jgi:HK97 family phage portal protein
MTYGTAQPGLLARLLAALKAAPPPPGAMYQQQSSPSFYPINFPGWAEYERERAGTARDEARAKTAVSSSWVYACVNAIANEGSVARLVVKTRTSDTGEEDVENHDLERLWEAPNPFMGRSFLVSFWFWQRLLLGKAYLYWVPDSAGRIVEVWPVPALTLTPIKDPKRFISGYWFKARPAAQPIRIDARFVTYSRIPHPFDIYDGLSPLAAAMVDVEAELAMAAWNRSFFSNENATPEGMITVAKDMLDPDIARVRQEIADFFGGGKRRVAVARAGDMDWKPFGRSQKDMEFLQGRTHSGEAIMRVFGIPAGYFAKEATRANSEGAKATMIENAVWPHLVALAEDLNAQTLPAHWPDPNLRVGFDDIRPRNRALEMQEWAAMQPFTLVNELRKLANLEELPEDDKRGGLLVKEIEMGAAAPDAPGDAEMAEADPESLPPAELPENGADAATGDVPPEVETEEGAIPADATAKALPLARSTLTEIAEAGRRANEAGPVANSEARFLDLRRWERKALAAVKAGKRAAVKFASDAIPADEAAAIRAALETAQDAAAVKAAFKADDADARADRLIGSVYNEALAWARAALEGEDAHP